MQSEMNESEMTILEFIDAVNKVRINRAECQRLFFDYWKDGAALAGHCYFGDGTKEGMQNAVRLDDLAPSFDEIEGDIGWMSHGQVIFIVSMYCFYNDVDGAKLCKQANVNLLGDLTYLDSKRREVIAGLIINYSGW